MRSIAALQDSLERLSSTRINGRLGLACDVGVAGALLLGAFRVADSMFVPIAWAAAGWLVFSFVEYGLHRWLFHGSARFLEEGHRRHHERPEGDDAMPFFFAPLAILALAGVLATIAAKPFALPFAGGFAAAYAAYGISHTLMHQRRFQSAILRRWAAAHHVHHHHPGSNFGVTSPLWDVVMGTRYVRKRSPLRPMPAPDAAGQ